MSESRVLGIYGASGLGREVLELAKIINKADSAKNGITRWIDFIFIDDGDVPAFVADCNVYKYKTAKEKYGDSLDIAMGIGEPTTREKLFRKIKADGIPTPTLIHPYVYIPESTTIGTGVIIQAGCFISVGVTVKDYALLEPYCAIGHDCVLDKGCIISSYDSIAGAVKIGRCTYLGMSTSVMELVSIGDYAVVGMGSMVFRDIPDEMIVMGNPARPMKKNEEKHVFSHRKVIS